MTAISVDSRTVLGKRSVARDSSGERRYLFAPVTDFLLLGGASFLLLPLAILLPASAKHTVTLVMFITALFINYPHFAQSYQIFYEGISSKAFDRSSSRALRLRYAMAGAVVPIALAGFLSWMLAIGDWKTMGIAGNVMAFFVGWHYVKQGYGMLIVDSVLKRLYFSQSDKKLLVFNAYAVWALAWVAVNINPAERDLYGIAYFLIDLPDVLLILAAGLACITSLLAAFVLGRYWLANRVLPLNGAVAYAVTLYLWLALVRIDPIWMLIVPALHSLQYLVVVWRFQLNRREARLVDEPLRPLRLKRFVAQGMALGFLGFLLVPVLLDRSLPISAGQETSVFLFAFYVFINVHHYFIDNVIWRSENAQVRRFLFNRL